MAIAPPLRKPRKSVDPPALTIRELEVARLLRYYKDKDIAALLGISHSRVRQLQDQIKAKRGLPEDTDRWDLTRYVRDNNLE